MSNETVTPAGNIAKILSDSERSRHIDYSITQPMAMPGKPVNINGTNLVMLPNQLNNCIYDYTDFMNIDPADYKPNLFNPQLANKIKYCSTLTVYPMAPYFKSLNLI